MKKIIILLAVALASCSTPIETKEATPVVDTISVVDTTCYLEVDSVAVSTATVSTATVSVK
jgi:hypothetical protein